MARRRQFVVQLPHRRVVVAAVGQKDVPGQCLRLLLRVFGFHQPQKVSSAASVANQERPPVGGQSTRKY